MAEKKEKQYVSDNAQLMADWDWEKNNAIDPSNLMLGSGKKVWWKCKEGHEWQAVVSNRNKGSGCPYCRGKEVLVGYNDLETKMPDLALEWHPTKNEEISPENISIGSNRKVWWQCKKNHEWNAAIKERVRGNGCPYCTGKMPIKGVNDLQTVESELALEWHPTKNRELKPNNVLPGSDKKVWWQCREGHEWRATIKNRTRGRCGCPVCK